MLSDRAIVMGARLGHIVEDRRVPLPRPRGMETTKNPVMHDFAGYLRGLLLHRDAA